MSASMVSVPCASGVCDACGDEALPVLGYAEAGPDGLPYGPVFWVCAPCDAAPVGPCPSCGAADGYCSPACPDGGNDDCPMGR